jgi:hypothetical protein
LCQKKKNEKKKKKAKKKKRRRKCRIPVKKKKNLPFNLLSARKLLLFQKEKSLHFKKIAPVPARKILSFSLVSHLIQVDEFWLFFILFELLLDYFELVS